MPSCSSSSAPRRTSASSCSSCAATANRSRLWSSVNETELTHALVADDEPHIGRIIKMKLEQGPFRVTLAYDGREALEVLRREGDIGLVLLDLMMPYLSGLDVLAAMKRDDRLEQVPTIVLTAAGQEQQHHMAMELGASEFLTKPFSPKKLYARAAELVGRDGEGEEPGNGGS